MCAAEKLDDLEPCEVTVQAVPDLGTLAVSARFWTMTNQIPGLDRGKGTATCDGAVVRSGLHGLPGDAVSSGRAAYAVGGARVSGATPELRLPAGDVLGSAAEAVPSPRVDSSS
jgi:hypothetical protein